MAVKHAQLGPSGSSRWLSCTASPGLIELADLKPSGSSIYALEGSIAHELAAYHASKALWEPSSKARYEAALTDAELYGFDLDEMMGHADTYARLVGALGRKYDAQEYMFEQRLQTGIDGVWGTVDCAIYSEQCLVVVDYKYGRGVEVDAEDNSQLKLYALGALQYFKSKPVPPAVELVICQPRLQGQASRWEISTKELLRWSEWVETVVSRINAGGPVDFAPSEDNCRFCEAAGICRARMDHVLQQDFGTPPDLISNEELGEVLSRLRDIENWVGQVRSTALEKLYDQQQEVPGWKAVMSHGRRTIPDVEAATRAFMKEKFLKREVTRTQLQTLSALEKLVGGKDKLEEILGDLVVQSPGKPTIAPTADKRPAISAHSEAAADFAE